MQDLQARLENENYDGRIKIAAAKNKRARIKKTPENLHLLGFNIFGADGRNRTRDPLITSRIFSIYCNITRHTTNKLNH